MLCAHCGTAIDDTCTEVCSACSAAPLLDGRIRLEAILGSGAMGTTYRACRIADGGAVAVKELLFRNVDGMKTLELFEREAEVLKKISHPGVPHYFEHFIRGEGRGAALYIVQELVLGETLANEMERRRHTEKDVLEILAALLPTLAHLHAVPLVHRDLKPANVIRSGDRLVLVDFGSVRDALKDSIAGGSTITGTFGYMAPEQFKGIATPATDLYALGMMALVLLARRPPETFYDSKHSLIWPSDLPIRRSTERLLRSLVEPDYTKRASDAASVAESAAALIPDALDTRGADRAPRSRLGGGREAAAVIAASVLLLGAVLAGASIRTHIVEPPPPSGLTGPWSGKALPSHADGDPNPSELAEKIAETPRAKELSRLLETDGGYGPAESYALQNFDAVKSDPTAIALIRRAMSEHRQRTVTAPKFDPSFELRSSFWFGKRVNVMIRTIGQHTFEGELMVLSTGARIRIQGFHDGNHLTFTNAYDEKKEAMIEGNKMFELDGSEVRNELGMLR